MKKCDSCGHIIADNVDRCPYCGLEYRPARTRSKTENRTDGKSKKPLIILFVLLGVLVALGITAMILFLSQNKVKGKTFDFDCSGYTDQMNRILGGENKLDKNKWVENKQKNSYSYDGDDYSIELGADKESQKINKISVGPSDGETGVKMAAASMMSVDSKLTQKQALEELADIKEGKKDRAVINNSVTTLDNSKNRVEIEPLTEENKNVITSPQTTAVTEKATEATEAAQTTQAETEQETTEEITTEEPTEVSTEVPEELKSFLNTFFLNYRQYDHSSIGSSSHLILSVLGMPPCIDFDTYGLVRERVDNEEKFDGYKVDWILKNIFNVTDDQIQQELNANESKYLRRESNANGYYYYKMATGKGDPFQRLRYKSMEPDGEFTKVYFDLYDMNVKHYEDESQDKYNSSYCATVQLKNLDGGSYWSLYTITEI